VAGGKIQLQQKKKKNYFFKINSIGEKNPPGPGNFKKKIMPFKGPQGHPKNLACLKKKKRVLRKKGKKGQIKRGHNLASLFYLFQKTNQFSLGEPRVFGKQVFKKSFQGEKF